MSIPKRLERLERAAETKTPPAPGLVVLPKPEGGLSAMGRDFATVAEAQAAFPERTGPCIVVGLTDGRREVPDEAA